jgi:sulfite exporter TauE/SafE
MTSLIFSAFALGILGSLHCIGMCGPLVMSMPFHKVQDGKNYLATLYYHIGKAITYSLFGLLAGSIGKGFAFFKWQQTLSIIAGIALLLITLFPYLKNKIEVAKPIKEGFNKLFSLVSQQTELKYFFAFGFLNGFLPCGLVYTALAAATVTSSPFNGMIFMFFFGLGTIPSLTSIILFQHKISMNARKYFSKSAFYISIIIGVLLLLRGFNLGIPYISPQLNQASSQLDCCHKN